MNITESCPTNAFLRVMLEVPLGFFRVVIVMMMMASLYVSYILREGRGERLFGAGCQEKGVFLLRTVTTGLNAVYFVVGAIVECDDAGGVRG